MSTTIPDPLDPRAQADAVDYSGDPDPEVPERARGPRRCSAKYKAQILDEYEVDTCTAPTYTTPRDAIRPMGD